MKAGDEIPIKSPTSVEARPVLICPLLRGQNCLQAQCAWWDAFYQYCAVRGIHDITYYLSEISSKIPK